MKDTINDAKQNTKALSEYDKSKEISDKPTEINQLKQIKI